MVMVVFFSSALAMALVPASPMRLLPRVRGTAQMLSKVMLQLPSRIFEIAIASASPISLLPK